MKLTVKANWIWFVVMALLIAFSAIMVYSIERDFGKVEVSIIKIMNSQGELVVAKLFRPKTATVENPAPAVINMHGYQNDKSVQDPFSIELARRGFVVIAPDALGHGDSGGGLNLGGWFADPTYVMGNETALEYLITLPFVQPDKIGAMGHSMGGMNAIKLPALFPENIKALNQQASSPGTPDMPNILITQARFEEFAGFREGLLVTEDILNSESRQQAIGVAGPLEWDTTYGSFEDGTARRMAYINMDHHLLTLMNKSVAEAVDWMRLALMGDVKDASWIDPYQQIYMAKEFFGLLTLLGTLVSLLPLTNLLLKTKFFAPVAQPIPSRYYAKNGAWWRFATINMLIGGILYPLTTQYGGIMGQIEVWLPFMKMEMGNGVAAFYLANALVASLLIWLWYRKAHKEQGVTLYDLGVSFDENKTKIDWGIIGKTVLMGVILFLWMYLFEGFFQWALGVEFRFAWPYMRQFGQLRRVGYFFLYLIPALLFFLINGGLFLFGQARQKEYETPGKTQWMWWLKGVYAMVTGLFLVWAFQYFPYFFGAGPGFELVGLPQFSEMWPLMLWVYIPQFIILFWFMTWFYRRTGRIYLGSLMISSVAIWFLTAGTILLM